MSQPSCIEVTREGPVGLIMLNRPETLNALSGQMVDEIVAALRELAGDEAVRAVVLHGAGRAFSSGYELSDMSEYVEHGVADMLVEYDSTHEFARTVWEFPKPLIAAAHGYCLGGACEIAMLCDMTVSGESCMYGEPEIRYSTASPTLIMPWLLPMKVVKELLLTGSLVDARRAYELGMVNRVVPDEEVLAEALRLARVCSTISPLASKLTKAGINHTYEVMGLLNALKHHSVLGAVLDGTGTEELREFARISAEQGLKAAIRWRQEQFDAAGR